MWKWRYNGFSLSRDLARPCDQSVLHLYGWEPLTISHHPAKFGGHRHCGSEDMFSMIEEQDSLHSLKSVITVYL